MRRLVVEEPPLLFGEVELRPCVMLGSVWGSCGSVRDLLEQLLELLLGVARDLVRVDALDDLLDVLLLLRGGRLRRLCPAWAGAGPAALSWAE